MPSPPASAPKVDVGPLDISAYANGNSGIDYVTTFESGRKGPHVMVCALMHGNEVCGAHALAFLFEERVRPARGKLTLCFANVAAYEAFDPSDPTASRFLDDDMNRLWSAAALNGGGRSRERERARKLSLLVDRVDYLLDLHSMLKPGPPLVLCGAADKGRALARAIGFPAYVVADEGHANGTRLRDYGAFSDPRSPKTGLLIECGQHWHADSVAVAIEMVLRFLGHLGVVNGETAARHLPAARPEPQRTIEVSGPVTIAGDDFAFARDFRCFEVIARAGTEIARDGGRPVRTPYDDCVLVMPSGSLTKGQTAVRFGRFVA